jgi:hypothetical protein
VVAVGRLNCEPGVDAAEFALFLSDQWQDLGLGTALLKALVQIAAREMIRRIHGQILAQNRSIWISASRQVLRCGAFRTRRRSKRLWSCDGVPDRANLRQIAHSGS